MSNLDGLVPATEPDAGSRTWATVTDDSPLRIQIDGESDSLDFTPDTLVGGLQVDDRVWVEFATNGNPTFRARRALILGTVGGSNHFGGTSGDAVFIGDDGKLVDVNVADRIGVQGQQNAANGGFIFGSGDDTNLYRSAADTLKTDDTFNAVTDLQRNGVSMPRGIIGRYQRSASKTGIAGTMTAAVRSPVLTLEANRTYRVFAPFQVASTANEIAYWLVQLRWATDGSTATASSPFAATAIGTTYSNSGAGSGYVESVYITSTSPLSYSVALCCQRVVGSGTLTFSSMETPPYIVIEDIGPATSNAGVDL